VNYSTIGHKPRIKIANVMDGRAAGSIVQHCEINSLMKSGVSSVSSHSNFQPSFSGGV